MLRTLLLLLVAALIAACDRSSDTSGSDQPSDTSTPAGGTAAAAAAAPPSTPSAAGPALVPPEAVAWIRQHAIPFTTSRAESGFTDLQPLKQVIGDARIVALGEATHGTREFFEMKHRLLEFLVKEMGFTTFAIEATWPESNLVNEYVQTGQGDPAKLLSGLYFWTWNTQEVLDMILWMRRHNENPGNAPRVSFYGFDMQSPGMAMQNVIDYLTPLDPGAAERATTRYDCFQPYAANRQAYGSVDGATQAACHDALQAQHDELAGRKAELEGRTSPAAYARALQSARVALQGEELFAAGMTSAGSRIRDAAMAENAAWLLEQAGPGAKIVLWAHNGHVRNETFWMGAHLRARFGAEMVIAGFDFYSGSFNAIPFQAGRPSGQLGPHTVHPPRAASVEAYLHSAGLPRMIVDLRGTDPAAAATRWLYSPLWMHAIGAGYDSIRGVDSDILARLPQEYDLIIYFEETTPSRLLPFVR